ncbi:hypothetical protein [Fischerella thermalis]|uniref:hypothetical protein n=1 Tax=Fischerella thermalis TaxID=372787 RepID=UPI0011AF23DB|nr:hypothetical protein [Fischerella thermalis]
MRKSYYCGLQKCLFAITGIRLNALNTFKDVAQVKAVISDNTTASRNTLNLLFQRLVKVDLFFDLCVQKCNYPASE